MEMTQCRELEFFSETRGLRMEGRMWKMTTGRKRPSTSRTEENIELVRQKVHGDRRLTVRMIAMSCT